MNCSGEKGKPFSVISFPGLHKLQLLSSFQCIILTHWNHLTIKNAQSKQTNKKIKVLFHHPENPCGDHCVQLSLLPNVLTLIFGGALQPPHTGDFHCTPAGLEQHRRR